MWLKLTELFRCLETYMLIYPNRVCDQAGNKELLNLGIHLWMTMKNLMLI